MKYLIERERVTHSPDLPPEINMKGAKIEAFINGTPTERLAL